MKEMESICKKMLDRVAGAVACGIIDLEKKDLLELHHLPEFTSQQKVSTISALIYLFSGKPTKRLEETIHAQFGILSPYNADRQEIQVSFNQRSCFCKTINKGKNALVLITDQDSDGKRAWSELKSITPKLEPLIP